MERLVNDSLCRVTHPRYLRCESFQLLSEVFSVRWIVTLYFDIPIQKVANNVILHAPTYQEISQVRSGRPFVVTEGLNELQQVVYQILNKESGLFREEIRFWLH